MLGEVARDRADGGRRQQRLPAAIEKCRPGLALIDIGLPGLSGYDVARRLRENAANAGTHLVALTGYGQPSDVRKAKEAGFDDHLVKPLDRHRLGQILQSRRSPSDAAP